MPKSRTIALFNEVDLPDAARIIHKYPHELSGGQRQQVMIAMALAGDPQLLIADEPTTALDVTIQKNILQLLNKIRKNRSMGILFISHDLGVIKKVSDPWYGETYPSPLADRETHTHALQIADNRLTENVRSKLRRATGDVPVKLGTDVDLSGLAQANYIRKVNPDAAVFRSEDGRVFLKFSLTIPRTPAADIVDFIDALQFPFPSAESHEFFGPHMNCPLLLHSVYGLYM